MSSSSLAGFVMCAARVMEIPGPSPTVRKPSLPAKTASYISWRNSSKRGPSVQKSKGEEYPSEPTG